MDLQELPKPIRELAQRGDIDDGSAWPNYHELGVAKKHIPALIDIIRHTMDFFTTVETLQTSEDEPELTPETWLPMHAWRALGQMQAVEALPDLLNLLPLIDSEDMDIIQEEFPDVFALLGPPAIPQLAAYLANSENDMWARLAAADGMSKIAQAHAETRPQVIDALLSVLQGYAAEDYGFNGFIISDLADLKAVEAAPLVEEAFRADRVDQMVMGDWEDFQVAVGLLERRTTPSGFNLTSDYPSGMFGGGGGGGRVKEDKKTKKKRKMEKEARKKNRKRKKR